MKKNTSMLIRPALLRLTGIVTLLAAGLSAPAASYFADFNSGLPSGAAVFGNASVVTNGGFTNSGYLQLTPDLLTQSGSFVITTDLDNGNPVYGFNAQFKAFIGGGTGANGFGLDFGNLPSALFTEAGPGSGLAVTFRTYSDNSSEVIGVDVYVDGGLINSAAYSNLRMDAWVDASVQLHPDGTLDVYYDNFHAFSNYYIGYGGPFYGQLFGFGARTGGLDDNQGVDNLSINTATNQSPFLDYYFPIGDSVRPDAPLEFILSDYNTQVNTNTIVMKLDGTTIVPTVLSQSSPQTTIMYTPPAGYLTSGTTHTVSITFADNSSPAITNTFQNSFTVATYATLTNPASLSLVSANPGFDLRISQIDVDLAPTLQRAEGQLANQFIDPGTGQPYANLATVTNFVETGVINYSTAGYQGDFPTEPPDSIPGLPGTLGGDTNVAIDAVTYLYLPVGFYSLGVNSSDGFGLTESSTPDIFAPEIAEYNGIRAAADTTCTFAVTNAGYYPFRILYFVGGIEAVNPTADNPSLEFFSIDASGNETLINDTSTAGYIAAYTPAATLPYVQAVSPTPASTAIPYNPDITATLVDGTITVQSGTIKLWLNGTSVTPTITSAGGVTTVSYQSANLPLNSSNLVQLAFTDSASNRRTNQWYFSVENILQQLWIIPPGSATNATWAQWVTASSTERGLAYNPKTGHALLVSRSVIAGGPGASGGVGILDGNTGAFLGTLDVSQSINGVGTFKISMIGVAEDGVIYACNLTTSAGTAFEIYRWQNETAPQEVIWNQNPLGGATRCGDDFRVEGSGAGTRIIASGNSTVNTIPIFTTVDGTNFNGTAITVNGLATLPTGGFFRLGLAFGCGDTFYGQDIGAPTIYSAFSEPPGTSGVQLASYPIVAFDGTLGIGPIGVDIANQRLIGDETSGGSGTTHSMNLYDLSTFTTSANSPIDHKTFATSTGSFGTGSVDFTPDGTRVYTLDTGNGIIAFSLAPKVAAPSICDEPQTNLVAGLGSVGFMDVRAIGAPQRYQWYFNTSSPSALGTPLLNATNRTLDVYNVQSGQLGFYKVVISNATLQTSTASSGALLDTVMALTTQPASQSVDNGGSATFTVAANNGLAPYTYQWLLNGNNVGPNSASYTVDNASSANAGNYVAIVTDALGQFVASLPFTLSINGAPQIDSDITPNSLALPVGNTAVFSVSASGPGTLTYQWLRNGVDLTDNSRVSGSLTSTLTIANVQLSDSGSYQVVVSNSTGYVSSSIAPLTVTLISLNNGAGWASNGNASINNGVLSLTQGAISEISSAFLTEPVDVGAFRASWVYQDSGGGGADGAAFVLQNDPSGTAAIGGGGGAIGFVGIANSVALEFNIFSGGPNVVGMALDPGTAPVAGPYSTPGSVNLSSGHPIDVAVQYLGSFLSVTLTDSVTSASFTTNITVNITNLVGGNTAYVGFTGAAGGVASTQSVSSFLFTSLPSVQVQNAGGGALVLTWPVGTPGFLLQQNSSLNNKNNWVNTTNVVTLVNGQNQVTVTPTGSTEFYRLSSQ